MQTQTDQAKTALFLPYEADYKALKRWRLAAAICLYIVSAVSVATPLFEPRLRNTTSLEILRFVNYLGIIFYFFLHLVTDTFIYPATARLRRMDFIDNSLGAKFLGTRSINNFSNEEIPIGPYRMAVNCFENCFFTLNIATAMLPLVLIKNGIFATIFLTTAYFGFKDNAIGLPILNIFLSSLFLTELVHHLNFLASLKRLLERFKLIFMDKQQFTDNQLPHATLLILEYETTLAYNKAPSSDRLYLRFAPTWTKQWEELKKHYGITPNRVDDAAHS